MNSNIVPLFGQPVVLYNLNINNDKIIKYLKNLEYTDTPETIQNNSKSLISKRFDLLKDKELNELKFSLMNYIDDYISNILQYDISFKIINSWGTKVFENGYSNAHHHSHSLISGVYYPTGNKDFNIKFFKKNINYFWELPIKKYNIYNSSNWTFNIKDNSLLLFSSEIPHQIEINKSKNIRYSLAFNVNPSGFVGTADNRVYFN